MGCGSALFSHRLARRSTSSRSLLPTILRLMRQEIRGPVGKYPPPAASAWLSDLLGYSVGQRGPHFLSSSTGWITLPLFPLLLHPTPPPNNCQCPFPQQP